MHPSLLFSDSVEVFRRKRSPWRIRLFVIGYALGAITTTVLLHWGAP